MVRRWIGGIMFVGLVLYGEWWYRRQRRRRERHYSAGSTTADENLEE